MNKNRIKGYKNNSIAGDNNCIDAQKTSEKESVIAPLKLLLIVFLFALLFFVIFALLKEKFDFKISDDSLVITFIGIIATFIVVGNYVQVKRAEDKVEEINKILNKVLIDMEELKKNVRNIQIENAKLRGRLFNISSKGMFDEK